MSSCDKRLCLGIDGRKCGAHMAPVAKDPHPTCIRCRGRNCTRDSTCISCNDWSATQWNAFDSFYANKRSNTDRKKSSNCYSGESTSLTPQSLSLLAPGKQAAPSLSPPPLTNPPPSEGSGIREETK